MEKRAKVQRVDFPPNRRILAISDIHGNLPFLQGVLARANFTTDDILVLVGDLIEKGPQSLDTLRYIMELSQTHTVYTVCGNCDNLGIDLLEQVEGFQPAFFDHYLETWGERCLVSQMAAEQGVTFSGSADLGRLREMLYANYKEELDFLRNLPHVILGEHLVFVHGGVSREDDLEDLTAWGCMKNDDFRSKGYHFNRWVVVGHWPVTLYHPHIPTARPLIDEDSHIISIDGGCVLKLDGQLNALIIPDGNTMDFDYVAYDGLPVAVAQEGQEASTDSINIRWGDNVVTVLEPGAIFSRCRHESSGREIDILTDYLREEDGVTKCQDSTDYYLPVTKGERLHVVYTAPERTLVKQDGVTGWYMGKISQGHLEKPWRTS